MGTQFTFELLVANETVNGLDLLEEILKAPTPGKEKENVRTRSSWEELWVHQALVSRPEP